MRTADEGSECENLFWAFFCSVKHADSQSGRHFCHGARLRLEYPTGPWRRSSCGVGGSRLGHYHFHIGHSIYLAAFAHPGLHQKLTHQLTSALRKSAINRGQTMTKSKSKSLAAAIGLNLLLPGIGYLYMGRWIAGVFGGALVVAICMRSTSEHLFIVWMVTNLIMAIDMCLLNSRRHTQN